MNEADPHIQVKCSPRKWTITIYKPLCSLENVNLLIVVLKTIPQIAILNYNSSDTNFCNHIITCEFNGFEYEVKEILRKFNEYISGEYEIICEALDNTKLIGISNFDNKWGLTINNLDIELLKSKFVQLSNLRVVHKDNVYCNYTFQSEFFEISINLFVFISISPYPKNDPTFPWVDSGIRWKISKNTNEYLWDTSGDDLSILPEMW